MQWESNSTIAFTANRTNAASVVSIRIKSKFTYALNKVTDFVAAYDQPMQKIGSINPF